MFVLGWLRPMTAAWVIGGLVQAAAAADGSKAKASPEPEKEEVAITWWGGMSTEVNFGSVNIVFDPYVQPDEPRFRYIFTSHGDYDHTDEPTLRKLIEPAGRDFSVLFAPRGAFYVSRMGGPYYGTGPSGMFLYGRLPSDLSFVPPDKAFAMYPKYRDGKHGEPVGSDPEFHGPTEVVVGRLRVEGFRSHEDPSPAALYAGVPELGGTWPSLGYLVTDTVTGRSVAHTGDIWRAFPQMKRMRGKVDILFYPLGKLSMEEKVKMMNYMRPKIAVPTHYRLFEAGFPIPAEFDPEWEKQWHSADNSPDERNRFLQKMLKGHWYPSPDDPPLEIARQREQLKQFTRVVELEAGQRYILPTKLDELKGRQR
jgi:L-ascorbate metabolism protein UlaG (beta-lactamase superfamily)